MMNVIPAMKVSIFFFFEQWPNEQKSPAKIIRRPAVKKNHAELITESEKNILCWNLCAWQNFICVSIEFINFGKIISLFINMIKNILLIILRISWFFSVCKGVCYFFKTSTASFELICFVLIITAFPNLYICLVILVIDIADWFHVIIYL